MKFNFGFSSKPFWANSEILPNRSAIVQWIKSFTSGIGIDKVGSWDPQYRVGGWVFEGTISTGLISTALTYTDPSTLLPVVDTTDGSGDFATPVGGIVDFTIDGHYFPLEESTGNYVGATDGEYYAITGATWSQTDAVPSYADENGYTPSDGSTMYWDIDRTIVIPVGVNITKGSAYLGDSAPVPEYQFVGNATAWVDFNVSKNLGTSHTIIMDMVMPTVNGRNFMGTKASTSSFIGTAFGGNINYRASGNLIAFVVAQDGLRHKFKIVRVDTALDLYIDDVLTDSKTLGANTDMIIDSLFRVNNATNFDTEMISTDLDGEVFSFTPPSTVNSTGSTVATIQSDDGSRIQEV